MASIPFPYVYTDPYIFFAIMLLDIYRLVSREVLIVLYICQFVTVLIKYSLIMNTMIQKLTKYLDINFITVKNKKEWFAVLFVLFIGNFFQILSRYFLL